MYGDVESLDVLVVGAGMGGLSTAIALQRDGHRVRVIDRVPRMRPVGAGISLWSNGVKVLNLLGLGEQVAAIGGTMDHVTYRDPTGAPYCDFSLDPLVARVGQRPYPVRRSDLQDLLFEAAGPEHITLGAECVGLDQDDDRVVATVESADGTLTQMTAEVVVVADGARSSLREHVLGHDVDRYYVGYHNWNGIVPKGMGRDDAWTVYLGEGKRVSTMPVRDGHYFFFDVPLPDPDVVPGWEDESDTRAFLTSQFGHWDGPVLDVIAELDPAATNHVVIRSNDPVRDFARGRVALLGDAVHATPPDLGQGGCQAMEDALVLARYLRSTNMSVADALRRYSDERVPRTADVMERATKRARMTHGEDPEVTEAWYREIRGADGSDIINGICRTIEAGPCR
jgi:FAD-dependent urate hydroxylase